MLKTPILTDDQKRMLQAHARRCSKDCGQRITSAEILAKALEAAPFERILWNYYQTSPAKAAYDVKARALDREVAARDRARFREARAFLRTTYRKLRKDGQYDPMQRACEALAKKLGCAVRSLDWEMRPPEWTPAPFWERPAGWWYKAGRKWPKSRPAWDDRSWPGRAKVRTQEEIDARRKASEVAFAADLEHERKRLQAIADRRGMAITGFCPEHGKRLFSCDACIRPKRHAFVDGHSYGDELRVAIFGSDVYYGRQQPGRVLMFPKASGRTARKVAA